jgi:hypothetical protein
VNARIIAALGVATAVAVGARMPPARETQEWTLREELRVGDAAGPADDLSGVSAAVAGRDGMLYVAAGSGEIVIFDRRGSAVRRLPIGAASLGWIGDTLWTIRPTAQHVTLLGARGAPIGRISFALDVEGSLADLPIALLADRSLLRTITPRSRLEMPTLPPPKPPAQYRMPVIPPGPAMPDADPPGRGFLVRTSSEGKVLQGLEIFTADRTEVTVRDQYGDIIRAPYPFHEQPLIAVTPDGAEIVFVERYQATRPDRATYTIARFDIATRKRTVSRHEYVPTPMSETMVDSLLGALVDSAVAPRSASLYGGFTSPAAARAAIRAAVEVPAWHVPVTDILAAADRGVWLRERATRRWIIHARDGRAPAGVTLPPGERPVFADADVVWTVAPLRGGPAGAQALVRYRIVRP